MSEVSLSERKAIAKTAYIKGGRWRLYLSEVAPKLFR